MISFNDEEKGTMKKRVLSILTVFVFAVCLFSETVILIPNGPASETVYAASQKKTGLYKSGGAWKYYSNGSFTKATGLAQKGTGSDRNWYYVKNGKVKKATTIAKRIGGDSTLYYVKKGVLNHKTGTVKVNGKTYYLQKGVVIPVAKNVKGKLPESSQLKQMLTYFSFNGRSYNQSTGTYSNEFVPSNASNLLGHMIAVTAGYSCANWQLYPVEKPKRFLSYETGATASDPRGLMNHDFIMYSEKAINWIGTNIFNLSQKKINQFRDSSKKDSNMMYFDGGIYYHMTGGVGGPFPETVKIKQAWKAGGYYYIQYSMDFGSYNQMFLNNNDNNFATLKLKTVNGRKYWSLYAHSTGKFKLPNGKTAKFIKAK